MNIAVFAYNFPHKKSQDFLMHLFVHGWRPIVVLAADPVELDIPAPAFRSKIRHGGLVHPRTIADAMGSRYEVVVHNSDRSVGILTECQVDLGIVAGARILKKYVIDACRLGVLNFHPGLIPEARGLDTLFWSIYNDLPLGVTSHLIDSRVDAGRVIEKREIDVYKDDTLIDLSERLYDSQLDMLNGSILKACAGEFLDVKLLGSRCNKKMPRDLELRVLEMLPDYVRRHSCR